MPEDGDRLDELNPDVDFAAQGVKTVLSPIMQMALPISLAYICQVIRDLIHSKCARLRDGRYFFNSSLRPIDSAIHADGTNTHISPLPLLFE